MLYTYLCVRYELMNAYYQRSWGAHPDIRSYDTGSVGSNSEYSQGNRGGSKGGAGGGKGHHDSRYDQRYSDIASVDTQ